MQTFLDCRGSRPGQEVVDVGNVDVGEGKAVDCRVGVVALAGVKEHGNAVGTS